MVQVQERLSFQNKALSTCLSYAEVAVMRKLSAKFSFYKIICRQRLLFKITVVLPIDNRRLPFFSILYAIYHHQEKKCYSLSKINLSNSSISAWSNTYVNSKVKKKNYREIEQILNSLDFIIPTEHS